MNFNHVDLFSGIGGFALACKWAGIETVQFVEIDPFCQKVLQKNFFGVPIHDDIKTFKWDGRPVFLLTGGFPCQPYSQAGKRRGAEDDRALWPEMFRVIQEIKPCWVLGENVAGFIGMGLEQSLFDLESAGYETQPFIIPACAVNAPHRRDRVWIVANVNATRQQNRDEELWGELASDGTGIGSVSRCYTFQNVANSQGDRRDSSAQPEMGREEMERRGRCGFVNSGKNVTNTPSKGLEGTMWEKQQRNGGRLAAQDRGEQNTWNQDWYEVATCFCRMDARVPNRADRLKSLGNAIVPQVAYQIIKAIVEIETNMDKT